MVGSNFRPRPSGTNSQEAKWVSIEGSGRIFVARRPERQARNLRPATIFEQNQCSILAESNLTGIAMANPHKGGENNGGIG